MSDLNFPDRDRWDPFCQRVQRELIERLGLENAEISVDRHDGKNMTVLVKLTGRSEDKSPSCFEHHELGGHQIQLTMGQLTSQVQSIVDVLLIDCDVWFGDIKFVVKKGLLKGVVFSYSTLPQESTASFFLVKV